MKFHPEARAEYKHEITTLHAARPGYGRRLVEAVRDKLAQIESHPASGQPIPRVPKRFNARQFTIEKFGLSLIVVDVAGESQVLAVAPGRKRPGYWRHRLASLEP